MPTDGRRLNLHIRISEEDRDQLDAVTKALDRDDASSTVRSLIREKYRELGLGTASAPAKPAPKKKRRAAP